MSVINFAAKKAEREPTWAGLCICGQCRHEWAGIGPIGTTLVECPNCLSHCGHLKFKILYDQFKHWVCKCGNDLMYRTPEGDYCPMCGTWAE